MLDELIIPDGSDGAALAATVLLRAAFTLHHRKCGFETACSPPFAGAATVSHAAGRRSAPRVHLLTWETSLSPDARRAFADRVRPGVLATVIAAPGECERWRDSFRSRPNPFAVVTASSLATGFVDLARVPGAIQLLEAADKIRAGDRQSELAQLAFQAASRRSLSAVREFFREIYGQESFERDGAEAAVEKTA